MVHKDLNMQCCVLIFSDLKDSLKSHCVAGVVGLDHRNEVCLDNTLFFLLNNIHVFETVCFNSNRKKAEKES